MDNTIDKKALYDEWIKIANIDYEAGRRMYEEHWPQQYINICYHSQQATEKYLKGYLIYHGEDIIRTHVLEDLIDICIKYNSDFNNIKDMCIYLTPFATQIRYPNNSFDITDIETKKALDYTKKIIDFVNDVIEKERY